MRTKCLAKVLAGVFLSFGLGMAQSPADQPPKSPPPVFIPSGTVLLTELQLTRDDLLPLVAQILSNFGIQQSGGRVVSGEEIKGILSAMEALWLVEYEVSQRGVTVADSLKSQQTFMEQQGWKRIFWNRSPRGNREVMLMVEPPRNGLFFVQARESAKTLRVLVVRTKGMIDAPTAIGLLMTFLVKPEGGPATPVAPPLPSEKKEQPQPEKASAGGP